MSLGTMDPDTPMVTQPRAGLVAWTEPDGGDLVVYDVTTHREAGRVDGWVDSRVIGWDRERLYFHREGNDWSISLVPATGTMGEPESRSPPRTAASAPCSRTSPRAPSCAEVAASWTVFQPFVGDSLGSPAPPVSSRPTATSCSRTSATAGRRRTTPASGAPEVNWFNERRDPVTAAFTARGARRLGRRQPRRPPRPLRVPGLASHINSSRPESEPCTARVDLDELPMLAGIQPGLVSTINGSTA